MRALHLAAESTLDMTVQAQALQERLARLQKQAEQQNPELVLYMPPVTVNAGWTGKATPRARLVRGRHRAGRGVRPRHRRGPGGRRPRPA